MATLDIPNMSRPNLEMYAMQLKDAFEGNQARLDAIKFAREGFKVEKMKLAQLASGKTKTVIAGITPTLFCEAELTDHERFLVDIGTGYVIDGTPEVLSGYYDRKIVMLDEKLTALGKAVETIAKDFKAVTEELEKPTEQ